MIVCKTCNEEKDESSFYIRKETGKLRLECKQCWNVRTSKWQAENREKTRGYVRKSCKRAYNSDPEKYRAKTRQKRLKDPELYKLRVQKSYFKMQANITVEEIDRRRKNATNWRNNNRDKCRENVRKTRKKYPSKHASQQGKRRALKINATPKWLSAIHLAQIQEFYDIALARTVQSGVVYEVDHIHPLNGDKFNGLHVPWNLQVITASENRAKSNKLMEI